MVARPKTLGRSALFCGALLLLLLALQCEGQETEFKFVFQPTGFVLKNLHRVLSGGKPKTVSEVTLTLREGKLEFVQDGFNYEIPYDEARLSQEIGPIIKPLHFSTPTAAFLKHHFEDETDQRFMCSKLEFSRKPRPEDLQALDPTGELELTSDYSQYLRFYNAVEMWICIEPRHFPLPSISIEQRKDSLIQILKPFLPGQEETEPQPKKKQKKTRLWL